MYSVVSYELGVIQLWDQGAKGSMGIALVGHQQSKELLFNHLSHTPATLILYDWTSSEL